jgi:hypothetical protein
MVIFGESNGKRAIRPSNSGICELANRTLDFVWCPGFLVSRKEPCWIFRGTYCCIWFFPGMCCCPSITRPESSLSMSWTWRTARGARYCIQGTLDVWHLRSRIECLSHCATFSSSFGTVLKIHVDMLSLGVGTLLCIHISVVTMNKYFQITSILLFLKIPSYLDRYSLLFIMFVCKKVCIVEL